MTTTMNAALRFQTQLPSGHVLSLRQGDITNEAVDAIVNAANEYLSHGGGLAGRIVERGGAVIQHESNLVGYVPVGQAHTTTAGALPARIVIHAVGPFWDDYGPDENNRLLASAATQALEIAREKGLASIAFPAISSGIFGFPKHRCAQVMVEAVTNWASAHPNDKPRDLRFTIIDEPTLAFFEAELEQRFGADPQNGERTQHGTDTRTETRVL